MPRQSTGSDNASQSRQHFPEQFQLRKNIKHFQTSIAKYSSWAVGWKQQINSNWPILSLHWYIFYSVQYQIFHLSFHLDKRLRTRDSPRLEGTFGDECTLSSPMAMSSWALGKSKDRDSAIYLGNLFSLGWTSTSFPILSLYYKCSKPLITFLAPHSSTFMSHLYWQDQHWTQHSGCVSSRLSGEGLPSQSAGLMDPRRLVDWLHLVSLVSTRTSKSFSASKPSILPKKKPKEQAIYVISIYVYYHDFLLLTMMQKN